VNKFFIKTYGCKVNQYDSQVLREGLLEKRYVETGDIEEADLAIINSCTVTAKADKECRQMVRKLAGIKPSMEIFVTGCYAKRAEKELKEISKNVKLLAQEQLIKTVKDLRGHSRAFVKLQDGCDAFCSYCVVPYVRPRLESKPLEQAMEEIGSLADRGYKEVVLCGIRLGKYGYGLEVLLQKLLKIKKDFRVRLSSLEVLELTDNLLELMSLNRGRICGHLHIPLQSGSDKILKMMNRPYLSNDFLEKVSVIRSKIPDIALTTDIIAGFPGETDKDFDETISMINESKFSRLHVFGYSPRPGTRASAFEGAVAADKVRDRLAKLGSLDADLRRKYIEKFVGSVRQAVREDGKNAVLTDNYLSLPLSSSNLETSGRIFDVRILEQEGRIMAEPI
jgi:threonylcarbamoyladenosine tRNA methylthiotransferase MtaB